MQMEKWGIKQARVLEESNDENHGKVFPFLTEKGWFLLKNKKKIERLELKNEEQDITIPYSELEVVEQQNAYKGEIPFNYAIQVLDKSIESENIIEALNERKGGMERVVLDHVQSGNIYFFQTAIQKRKC